MQFEAKHLRLEIGNSVVFLRDNKFGAVRAFKRNGYPWHVWEGETIKVASKADLKIIAKACIIG